MELHFETVRPGENDCRAAAKRLATYDAFEKVVLIPRQEFLAMLTELQRLSSPDTAQVQP